MNIKPKDVTNRILSIEALRQKFVAGYASVKILARPSISFFNLAGLNHAKKVVLNEAIVAKRHTTKSTIKYSLDIIIDPYYI